ncbi:uncharacterized protein LOC141718762 [Apium graveolens]|uniref:uncharacterized protein LOC141718762 n=1 Tax=Apium graveolens TaxID=4045 RepID=UPI003D7ABB09
MPHSICRRLGLEELKKKRISLQLADRTVKYPLGIIEDVLVKVDKYFIPCDFVVLEMDEDVEMPIILGRPFLATTGTIIDVNAGKLTLNVGEDKVEFDLNKAMKMPSFDATYFTVDIMDEILKHEDADLLEEEQYLYDKEDGDSLAIVVQDTGMPKIDMALSISEAPQVELKPLPSNIRYAFLGDNDTYPVIVSSLLNDDELDKLLHVLRTFKSSIGWTIKELKGISPALCMHRISLEDNHKPVIEGQRRLNPILQDVVKKEITKLLDAGIIYSVPHSKWVSPIHVVPKKGGMTVMHNEKNELIPTRTVTDFVGKNMEVFMDDFTVYGSSFDTCLTNLSQVLQRCEETNLVLNWEKCHFMVKDGIVLGYKISSKGIEVDRAKIEVIEKLPPPSSVKGIRSFLGHAGFYRPFIKDFSKISRPLCNLLEKDSVFDFDESCLVAFNSDYAVGAVLGQKKEKRMHVIYYASKTLDDAQINYATTEKELLAVDAKPRLIRWILLLQEFDLEIRDKKGSENLVADHLSRLDQGDGVVRVDRPINDSFPEETLLAVSMSTLWYADFVNYIVGGIVPSEFTYQQNKKFLFNVKHYFWEEPLLYKACANGIMRRCVPHEEIPNVLNHHHALECGGHNSSTKKVAKI